MPIETQAAVDWALTQEIVVDYGFETVTYQVSKGTPQFLVDKVCEYFATNGIEYGTFSYADLEPFLN